MVSIREYYGLLLMIRVGIYGLRVFTFTFTLRVNIGGGAVLTAVFTATILVGLDHFERG